DQFDGTALRADVVGQFVEQLGGAGHCQHSGTAAGGFHGQGPANTLGGSCNQNPRSVNVTVLAHGRILLRFTRSHGNDQGVMYERNIGRGVARTDPDGIRTRVAALKGPCPRPLDDGATPLNTDGCGILEDTRRAVKFACWSVEDATQPAGPGHQKPIKPRAASTDAVGS